MENRDRFHFLDWDDYSLVAVSMRSEQSCKPPGYKGARPSLAMGSRIPTPNHHTIRQYMPVINARVSAGCFDRIWVHTYLKQISCDMGGNPDVRRYVVIERGIIPTLYVYGALQADQLGLAGAEALRKAIMLGNSRNINTLHNECPDFLKVSSRLEH